MFTDYFYPELGGIQDSVATMSRALGERGHRIDIIAPAYARRDYRRGGATVREPGLGANISIRRRFALPFPSSTRQSRLALPSPAAAWGRPPGAPAPDLIHVHSFFGIGLEALLAGAWLGVPVIGTNHTTIAGFGPHLPVSVERAAAYVLWFYNRCNFVTAPSRSVFDELGTRRLLPAVPGDLQPDRHGLVQPRREARTLRLRARFGMRRPTITYAGRLGPEKNIEVLLHAVAILRNRGVEAELAIAGHGSHEPIFRGLAAEFEIADVQFLGTLPQGTWPDCYRQ